MIFLRRVWQPLQLCQQHSRKSSQLFKSSRQQSLTLVQKVGIATVIAGAGGGVYYAQLSDIEKRRLRVSVGGVRRFFRSLRVGLLITADYWWSLRGIPEDSQEYDTAIQATHQRCADRILYGCLTNGGLYIKLGQGLVSLNHILPKEYLHTLKQLQDKCLTRRPDEVQQLFMEEFKMPLSSLFDSFEEEPIAAASLAQVFKAKTKAGEEVAVKVQYIDLQDRFVGDIATVQLLLKFSALVHPKFDFRWVLEELTETLEQELDFEHEAANSIRCASDLKKFSFVYVPKVHPDLTKKRVLTTEYIDGLKVNNVAELRKQGYSFSDIDTKLFTAFGQQIFHTGFVHADPHPGNVLVRRSKKDGKAELVLLDHGLYQELPSNERQSLCNLWHAIVIHDFAGMERYSKQLGVQGGYRVFCMSISQRYIPPDPANKDDDVFGRFWNKNDKTFDRSKFKNMTREEKQLFQKEMEPVREQMMKNLRGLTPNLFLVLRNINTIRAIAKDHGDPVDRYQLMARIATQGAFGEKDGAVRRYTVGLKRRFAFELRLVIDAVKMWFFRTVYKVLFTLGYVPDFRAIAAERNIA